MRSSQRTSPHRPRGVAVRAGVLATGLFLLGAPSSVLGQQLGEGMKRTGTVGITNEEERRLFNSLICTCGCPRETLGTCTCDFAHARRADETTDLARFIRCLQEIVDLVLLDIDRMADRLDIERAAESASDT